MNKYLKYLINPPHPITVLLVGCGGTGSLILELLGRIHLALLSQEKPGLFVTVLDGDVVSEANVGRQLFTKSEIGSYKAICSIERINRFYGTNWIGVNQHFDIYAGGTIDYSHNLIISCVDNVKTRKQIDCFLKTTSSDIIEQYKTLAWIDTGNSFDSGQVVMGSKLIEIPTIVDMFPNWKESEKNKPSCTLAQAIGIQDLMINQTIATITAQLLWDMVSGKTLSWSGAFVNLKSENPIRKIPFNNPNLNL